MMNTEKNSKNIELAEKHFEGSHFWKVDINVSRRSLLYILRFHNGEKK